MLGYRELISSEARRGFILLSIMSVAFGMAMSTQQNIVTNYFEEVLGLEGSQFGFITAIREVPGFLLIFLTALFYKMSLPRLTAMMLLAVTAGYILFGLSNSFWTVAPWVILSSMGYHTVMQNQYALGLSLTTESRSGAILGRMSAINSAGALLAMVVVLAIFQFDLLSYRGTFVLAGLMALVAAIAVFHFPNLNDGKIQEVHADRPRYVLRGEYRYYYYLTLLDGARQQIFFSFGLFVLVAIYGMSVPEISILLISVRLIAMLTGPWIGTMIDRHGEKQMLGIVNIGYIVALAGYAFVDSVYLASFCYLIYAFIMPLSGIGSATYLRKVAVRDEIAPSLAMGITLQHAAAVVVPVTAGIILTFVGYQIPFLIACVFATFTILVTRRLDPATQKSPARLAQDKALAQVGMEQGAPAAATAD